MRIGEVDGDAGDFGTPLVLGHLTSLIVGQGKAPLRVDPVEDGAKASHRGIGCGVFPLGPRHEERRPFDPRTDGRGIAGTFDQIALPVPRRSSPRARGRRRLRDCRRPAIHSLRNAPRGRT